MDNDCAEVLYYKLESAMNNDGDETNVVVTTNSTETSVSTGTAVTATAMQQGNVEAANNATTSIDSRSDTAQDDDQLKQEITAKQQGRSVATVAPGAVFETNGSKSHHNWNADRTAKQSANGASRPSVEDLLKPRNAEDTVRCKLAMNSLSTTSARISHSMQDLEAAVRSKLDSNVSSTTTGRKLGAKEALKSNGLMQDLESSGGNESLRDLESAVMSKVGRYVASTSETNATLIANTQIDVMTYEKKQNECGGYTKKDEVATSAMSSVGKPNMKSSSLECGLYSDDGDESGLAVALAIDEEDEVNIYRPSAVEYDPDAKPPTYKNRRFRLYAFLLVAATVIGTVGAVLSIILSNENVTAVSIPYRDTIGIRETLAHFISEEYFDDSRNPYRKALDWITYTDPMAITPDSPRFMQRFILAYFYYATSAKKPWTSSCAPSSSENESDTCKYEFIRSIRPIDDRSNKTGSRWLSNTDECEWAGMQCDGLSQISKIVLGMREMQFFFFNWNFVLYSSHFWPLISISLLPIGGMGISGTFPEGLTWLPYLRSIRIGFDEIEGPLPGYLSNMKHLFEIALPGNRLTGTIPDVWLESRMLSVINVEDNQINGTISEAISNHMDLKELIIRDNNFTGTIPNELGSNCINMVNLRIDGNIFNGTFPTTLGMMEHISIFDISNNFITGTIPEEIGNWIDIDEFFMSNNLFTGTIPEKFWNAEKLISIDVSNNQLSGTISGKISKMYDLTSISVENNQFTGPFPSRLGQTYVKYIYASGNQFNGTVASQLCDLVTEGQLIDLVFDCAVGGNGETGGVPEIVCPEACCSLCCDANGDNCVQP